MTYIPHDAKESLPGGNPPPDDEPSSSRDHITSPGGHITSPGGHITLSPFYHSSVNEVTKPGSLVFVSHYFARKWAPDLGALGVAIVLCLRDRCYHDRRSGEKRDLVEKLPVREIAKACGVSEKTVRREFERNVVLKRFVVAEYEYKAGRVRGSVLEDAYSYRVAMDDPVHPSDEQRLLEIVRAKAEAQEKGQGRNTREAAKERARRAADGTDSTPGQFDQAWTKSPGGVVKLTTPPVNLSRGGGQIDQASNVLESSESNKNPLNPPAAPGDSLSLFGDGETPAASGSSAAAEEDVDAIRAAIKESMPPPKLVTLQTVEAEWKAMPPDEKDRFRPEAVRQLQAKGYASPPEKMVEPTMFKLFWVERKRLIPVPAI